MRLESKTYCLFLSFLLGIIFLNVANTVAQPAGYDYYKQITIQASQVPSTQTSFPVLISITDPDLAANVQNANGYDIIFSSDANGNNILNHQIESYNAANGTLVAWVGVPSLSGSSNTSIYMFYGNSSVSANPSTTATWSSEYTSVYHLNNFADATATGNNGTNNGSINAGGKIGNARQFDGSNDYIQLNQNLAQVLAGNGTVSAWIRTSQTGSNTIWEAPGLTGIEESGGGNDIFYGFIDGSGRVGAAAGNGTAAKSSNALNNNQWHHVVFTRNASNGQILTYVNGIIRGNVTSETGNKTNAFNSIGRIEDTGGSPEYYQGVIDEFRVSNQIFSQNRIQTEYNNQNNPSSFYSVGNQQAVDNVAPAAPQNVTATAVAGGNIEISFDDVDETDSGVTSYSVKRSTSQGGPYSQVSTVTDNESATYNYSDNTASDGTTYYYVVTAIDAAGNESNNSAEVSATADGTAPTVEAATVNGQNLQIDYSEILNDGSVPAPGDFNIQVNGSSRTVTNVAINGDKVDLTLNPSVVQGDNVSGSYTAGSNPIEDQAGNNAANLSGPVTNNTSDSTPPNAPQNVLATAIAGGDIAVSFNDVDEVSGTGVNSYSVKRSANPGGPYSQVGTVTDDESASYMYTDNTVSDGTTYYYVVTAIDAATNESSNSSEVSAAADGMGPTLETATVNSTILQLDYDEQLNAGSVPAAGAYAVQVNSTPQSISNVGINGDKVNITLVSGVNPGDNITISYTAGANPVEDIVGNPAANFSNQTVTNNSDNTAPMLNSVTVNSSSLKLDYNETLDPGSVPAAGDYTVRVNGNLRTITNVQLNNMRVNLTLSPAVVSGDNVQVDYTAGTNPVQDAAGNNVANFSNQTAANNTFSNSGFGPDPCPIVNGQDAAWACFDGINGGTTMSALVGNLEIATVDAVGQTTFAPNALQQWASGAFSGDQYNGPQANPIGASGNASSFDITIPSGVPSDAIIFALNRLRPSSGNTSYTLEAFNSAGSKITVNDWVTGQGTDGGVCTNSVNLVYTNGNTTIEFRPTVSGDPSCSSSSTPVWFRITDDNVARIEIRKVAAEPDNIHLGMAVTADFGDAPNVYNTRYNSRANPPAFHLLNNGAPNTVYFGSGVDGDGNGRPNTNATGDDNDSGLDSGDDEDGIASLPTLTAADTQYSITLSCTDGGAAGGWIDFDQSDSFDFNEYTSGTCLSGSVTLTWTGLSGLNTGQTYARFRIASSSAEIAEPAGYAADGEVEDYTLTISPAAQTDLEIVKAVDNSTPIEGDHISFTVKVVNNGPDNATDVEVTDQLPAGLTYVSSTPQQGTYNNSTGTWNVGNISANDSTSLVLTASVNSGTSGQTITNTASVAAVNESDPVPSNNSASSGITVVQPATDISVVKIVDNAVPIEGETVTYTVSVTNEGPRNATNLSVIDQLPTGVTYQSSTASKGSYNQSTGIWSIGTLNNGESASLTIQVSIDDETVGSDIANTAALNSLDQTDPNDSNNSSTATIDVVPPNEPTTCNDRPTLSFENPTLISGSAGQVGAVYRFNDVYPASANEVYARVEILTLNNIILHDIDNAPSYTGIDDELSPFIENNSESDGYIDFRISFFDASTDQPKYMSFAATTADIDGTSSGGGDLKDFVGYESLTSFTWEQNTQLIQGASGSFLTFESANFQDTQPTYSNYTDYMVYATYTNEPTFRLRTGVKANGMIDDRTISVSFNPCKINEFNNPVSENITDVGITKTVDNVTPQTGETITYTINAENTRANAVGDVEITDQLPNDLTFVSATPSKGTYNSTSGIWDIGNFSGLESANLIIKATVNSGTEGTTISNTATLTNSSGTDQNQSNNSASADIQVFDPGSGMQCTEPPYFSFANPNLEAGSSGQVGAVYRFSNVRSGIDALVKITARNNAQLNEIDSNQGVSNANFSPLYALQNGNNTSGYIEWEIKFVQSGTFTPIKQTFAMTALDVDGYATGGASIRDYLSFSQNQSNTVEASTELTLSSHPPFQRFASTNTNDSPTGVLDTDFMVYIGYNYTSVLNIRTGSIATGGYTSQRLVDIDFRQCLDQEFDNPVVTMRNADIAVNKTTDNANPLAGETVNFTVTVTNNGPENATELDVNETLPAGLSLVSANPSQGTYNQLTKIWAVGTLNSGNSATLDLETTVNQGADENMINQAFVKGLNQADPVVANDTSEVAIAVSVPVEGIVFEDKTGNAVADGDTNFGDATGDQQAKANVKVHLFKDGGDGTANGADDTFIQTVQTNSIGKYNFQVGENGDYWIAVDSRTGGLSNGTTWAEQTYAPVGGLCTDGAGATTTRSTAGACFGGRRGTASDLISATPAGSDLANAEHVAKVTMSGSEITGINFGFSFNVVTHTDDGDDDATASRSIQGSLRQFIQNANNIAGANAMRFVPAVATNASGGGGNWWSITIGSALPAVTGPLTTIDGTAFDLNNPASELDTNTGSTGTGGNVGVDQLPLNTFQLKELDINLNDIGNNAFQINSTGVVNIRDLALYNNTQLLQVSQVSNGVVERNLLGNNAGGSLGNLNLISNSNIVFTGNASTSIEIRKNKISPNWIDGIKSNNANALINLNQNEIHNIGGLSSQGDGVAGIGTWTIEQNLIYNNGQGNNQSHNGGSGIEIGGSSGSSQNNVIRNNTIRDNKIAGITILNNVLSTTIRKNIINNNGTNYTSGPALGAGVRLTTPASQTQQGINISQNSFYGNYGLAIDIVKDYSGSGQADGVNPNDGALQSASSVPNRGLDYPVFTLTTLEGSTLHIEGYVGTFNNRLAGPFTIEIYKADNDGNNDGLIEQGGSLVRPHGEGRTLLSTITTNPDGSFSEDITVGGSINVVINDRITALAFSGSGNTSEFSSNQRVVPTGVAVSGYVYHDTNHNGTRNSGESGLESVTMVLYNQNENNCKSVRTDANGFYEFTNVLNGNYQLIEAFGESIPTPNICTPAAADPAGYISTTTNSRSVTINNLPENQDFGDFEGSSIKGNIFNDNGIGTGGTANDVVKNGGEPGINATVVKALSSSGATLDQATASAGGNYTLYVAKSQVPSGGTIMIREINKANYITIGGSAGTTGGTYSKPNDEVSFTNTVGAIYTGVNFADVEQSRLLTDGEQNIQPGGTATFQHQFQARTAGAVTFTTSTATDPAGNTIPVVLYRDINCNGAVDSGEPVLDGSGPVSVTTGQTVCLVLKVTIPLGTSNGVISTTTVAASMDFANTNPVIQQSLSRTDVVNVTETNGGLSLIKAVDKATAEPGEVLTYTITYENNGSDPINTLEIADNVPAFTTFNSASCGVLPNNLTNCTINAPPAGQSGAITWTFTGTMAPGTSGAVTYQVTIQD